MDYNIIHTNLYVYTSTHTHTLCNSILDLIAAHRSFMYTCTCTSIADVGEKASIQELLEMVIRLTTHLKHTCSPV